MADTVDLQAFVASFSGGDGLRVEESLGNGYVRLRTSEAERRQAKHDIRCVEDAVIELLRNARDAGATRIFLGTSREGDVRTLVVADDGSGIPASMHERVFDARVTSKLDTMRTDRWGVHGRGMALFSIRENATSAEVTQSDVGLGCAIRVTFDVSSLPERADQSSWPQLAATSSKGQATLRGPHNIYRACCEFALEERGTCNVYVGSPSEALATMRARCVPSAGFADMEELACVPVVERAAMTADAKELAAFASTLGIEVSERNAHRVIRGQILPVANALARLEGARTARERGVRMSDARTIRLSATDEDELSRALREAFHLVEQRYYVRLAASPSIRVGQGKVVVTYEFAEDD